MQGSPLLLNFSEFSLKNNIDIISLQIWNHYDSDMSGYLEGDEIDAFLKDMLQQGGHNLNPQRIADYKSFMVQFFLQIKTGSTRTLSNLIFSGQKSCTRTI